MPFNFPIQQNNFGQLFAEGIANAIGTYNTQRQLRRQQTLDQQQKALAEFSNPGFHFGEPPKTVPTDQIEVGTPSPAAANSFQQRIADATMPRVEGTSPSIIRMSGGYYDPQEAMQMLAPKMALAGRQKYLEAAAEASGKLAGDPGAAVARDATTRYRGAQADKLNYDMAHPKPVAPVLGSPEYLKAQTDIETMRAGLRPAPSQFVFPTGTDTQGNAIVLRGNTKTGEIARTDIGRPATGQAGEREAAQIAVAQNQVAEADKIMSAFEDQLLSGKRTIGTAESAAAKIALGGGPLLSTLSESAINKLSPDLAAYVRAAKAVSSAERLITPRGGSNALMHAESMLSGAGPHANADLVKQARNYRKALVEGLMTHGKAPVQQSGKTITVNGKTYQLPE